MKKIVSLALTAIMCMAFAALAMAAEVKTDHFSVDLPSDWKQSADVMKQQGSMVALFQNTKNGTAVTITVVEAPMSAKDVATQTAANMKSGGMSPSEPKEENGFYVTTFEQGGGKGVSYFGSNGKEFAVTTIVGSEVETGKEMLKNVKNADSKLIPAF